MTTQLDLFAAAPMARPQRPDTALLLAMSADHTTTRAAAPPPAGPRAVPMSMRSCIDRDEEPIALRIAEIERAAGQGAVAILPMDGGASELLDKCEGRIDTLWRYRMEILALATVIARMVGRDTIGRSHLAEAVSYWPAPL